MYLVTGMKFFAAVTTFGDSGFLMPASGGLLALLWASGARRTAFAFALSVAFCAVATITAKIGFMTCGVHGPEYIYSPSGHASLSTMFFASLAFVAVTMTRRSFGLFYAAFCLGLIILVAASRVILNAHSIGETLIGMVIGALSFGLFSRFASGSGTIDARIPAFGLAVIFAVHSFIGSTVTVEEPVGRIARLIGRLIGC
jgi:membrane-associated phospholipid phosphatase